jgi:hypothetical protein
MVHGTDLDRRPTRLAGAIRIIALGAALFSMLSLAIACIARTRERFMGIGQALMMPIFIASNAIYPLSLMPDWVRLVALINPLTHVVDILRALMIQRRVSHSGFQCDIKRDQDDVDEPGREGRPHGVSAEIDGHRLEGDDGGEACSRRFPECRCVGHAVACHGDDVALRPRRLGNKELLLGFDQRENDLWRVEGLGEPVPRDPVERSAIDRVRHRGVREADLAGDGRCRH